MTSENDSSPMTPAMTPGELEQALLEDPHIINAMVHDKITLDGSIRVGTIANNYCKREAVTFRLEPYNCWLSPRSIHAGHYQHFTIKSPLFDMLLAEEKYFDIRSLLVATDTEQQAAGEEGVLCLSRLVGHILNARRWHAEVEDATEADRAPEVICLSFPQHHVKATPPRTRNGSRVFLPSAQGEELAQRHAPALATHPEVKARKTTAATAEFLNAHGPLLSNDRTHTMVKVEYEVGGVHDESPVVQRARQLFAIEHPDHWYGAAYAHLVNQCPIDVSPEMHSAPQPLPEVLALLHERVGGVDVKEAADEDDESGSNKKESGGVV